MRERRRRRTSSAARGNSTGAYTTTDGTRGYSVSRERRVKWLLQIARSGGGAPRQPLGPMPPAHDVVRPEHERTPRAPDHPAEQALAPRGMTNCAIVGAAPDERAKRAACRRDAVRPSHRDSAEQVHRRPRVGELRRQSTFETEGELVLDLARSAARNRREDRLDPAVEVAAVDVKDAHCYLKAS